MYLTTRNCWRVAMTENEAIKEIKCWLNFCFGSRIAPELVQAARMATEALKEVQQYRAIGTLEECKIAVEKQRPKKPINPDDDYGTFKCPNCNGLIFTEDRFETHRYCLLCGQKLDWSDE